MESSTTNEPFIPPYISFSQLENMLERLRQEGMPSRIDRSYLASWSGSAQSQFLKAARALGLLEDSGAPTELLKQLVNAPDDRPALIGRMLQRHYPEVFALEPNATQAQLEEVFRDYVGISGSTTRKAIVFFLHAARFADVKLSPHFRAPRSRGPSSAKPRVKRRDPTQPDPPNVPNPFVGVDNADGEQRKAYVDLLLKKAETEGDTELYARIEWLLGFRSSPPGEGGT